MMSFTKVKKLKKKKKEKNEFNQQKRICIIRARSEENTIYS